MSEQVIYDLAGIETDFDHWYETKHQHWLEETPQHFNPMIVDWAGLHYLNSKIKFEGFMVGPVGVYYTVPVEARTRKMKDIKEFVDYCNNTANQIFLYDLVFIPNMPVYAKFDNVTFENIPLDHPYISEDFSQWKVRYGEVEA